MGEPDKLWPAWSFPLRIPHYLSDHAPCKIQEDWDMPPDTSQQGFTDGQDRVGIDMLCSHTAVSKSALVVLVVRYSYSVSTVSTT